MQELPLQRLHREKLNLRIGPEMAAYVQRRLNQSSDEDIAVIGGDARTGIPRRDVVRPEDLRKLLDKPAAGLLPQ